MKKQLLIWAGLIFTLWFLSGCLTCEKKSYTFSFTGKDSGMLTIKYYNIMSTKDDTIDNSEEDYYSLMNDYMEGAEIENEFPEATLVDKKLYEENGVLCGEVIFEFAGLSPARLYQHHGKGPIMYCLGCYSIDSEYFSESNGEYGGDVMPVVFWDPGLKTLELMTEVTVPDETTVSLLDRWKAGY